MIKLIASDLDGTILFRPEKVISQKVRNKLLSLTNNGTKIAVISGRDNTSLKNALGEAYNHIYAISCNGSLCVKDNKIIYSRPIKTEFILRAINEAKNGKNVVLCGQNTLYVYASSLNFEEKLKNELDQDIEFIKDASKVKEDIYKISFYGDGFTSVPFGLTLFYNRNGWTEYTSSFANKGNSLSSLRAIYNIRKEETAAIGDGENDINLLNMSGYPFSIDNTYLALEANSTSVKDFNEMIDILKNKSLL